MLCFHDWHPITKRTCTSSSISWFTLELRLEQVKEQRREIQEVRCRFEGYDAEQPSRTTRRNRVGLLRHNSSDTVCSGVYGNREFPERDSLSSRVLS
ncbi:hypothetical protein DY000_02052265 [Brassica cretica]|uniref:Uncharacterized protein n=1 Tax=Brassica cretica TaxID=69181 RepID=A0ABQ7A8H3_BRACR|nr:hypothetical protein DY000_02052265 [Brassica cretica]